MAITQSTCLSSPEQAPNPPSLASGHISRRLWLRFLRHVDVGAPCTCGHGETHRHWMWRHPYGNGYGYMSVANKKYKATHVAWIALRGPILSETQLDHLCRVPACVNPRCLEPVTQRENILRGQSISAQWAQRSHCAQGHPYDPSHTLIKRDGTRRCRICHTEREAARRQRLKMAEIPGAQPDKKRPHALTCQVCTVPFWGFSILQKYCSQTCASEAQRHTRYCQNCGEPCPGKGAKRKYCSLKCASAARRLPTA